jgi:hypothetical protein
MLMYYKTQYPKQFKDIYIKFEKELEKITK